MEGGEVGSRGLLNDPILNLNNADLKELTHSHPDGIDYPSGRVPEGVNESRGGDIGFGKMVERRSPGVKFNIYTPSNRKYTPYTTSDKLPEMEPIIITPRGNK